MKPLFFAKQSDLRKWFEKNHDRETEVFIGYYKVASGKPGITWSQSVDEALCFGWIDGIRRSIDEESYCNRFTPRKANSTWSAVNIKKVEELTKRGLMTPAGKAAFDRRKESNSKIYSYEKQPAELDGEYTKKFRANRAAWEFFQAQAPSYRKPAIYWVMSAKREETRLRRLGTLIEDSEAGHKIKPLRYGEK